MLSLWLSHNDSQGDPLAPAALAGGTAAVLEGDDTAVPVGGHRGRDRHRRPCSAWCVVPVLGLSLCAESSRLLLGRPGLAEEPPLRRLAEQFAVTTKPGRVYLPGFVCFHRVEKFDEWHRQIF